MISGDICNPEPQNMNITDLAEWRSIKPKYLQRGIFNKQHANLPPQNPQ
jgi:hypothetical protein